MYPVVLFRETWKNLWAGNPYPSLTGTTGTKLPRCRLDNAFAPLLFIERMRAYIEEHSHTEPLARHVRTRCETITAYYTLEPLNSGIYGQGLIVYY